MQTAYYLTNFELDSLRSVVFSCVIECPLACLIIVMNSFMKSTFEIPKGRLFSLPCLIVLRIRLTVTCRTLAAVQGSNRIPSGASDVTRPEMHRSRGRLVILTLGTVAFTSLHRILLTRLFSFFNQFFLFYLPRCVRGNVTVLNGIYGSIFKESSST